MSPPLHAIEAINSFKLIPFGGGLTIAAFVMWRATSAGLLPLTTSPQTGLTPIQSASNSPFATIARAQTAAASVTRFICAAGLTFWIIRI